MTDLPYRSIDVEADQYLSDIQKNNFQVFRIHGVDSIDSACSWVVRKARTLITASIVSQTDNKRMAPPRTRSRTAFSSQKSPNLITIATKVVTSMKTIGIAVAQ